MNDCPNAEFRDLLPDLLHDQLDAATRVRVEEHVTACASCHEELALLRSVHLTLRSRTVRVDVARIVAALPAPPAAAASAPARYGSVIPIASARRRRWADWRVAAAATLLIAGGTSLAVLGGRGGTSSPESGPIATAALPTVGGAPVSPERATERIARTVAPNALSGATAASAPDSRPSAGGAVQGGELALNTGLSDLTDGELRDLLGAIDRVQAVPASEPDPTAVTVPTPAPEGMP